MMLSNYEYDNQMSIFDYLPPTDIAVKVKKKLRLIEMFAGYGSQAMALKRLGVDFEHHRVIEFDKYAVKSYNAIHGTNFTPIDIKTVEGGVVRDKE